MHYPQLLQSFENFLLDLGEDIEDLLHERRQIVWPDRKGQLNPSKIDGNDLLGRIVTAAGTALFIFGLILMGAVALEQGARNLFGFGSQLALTAASASAAAFAVAAEHALALANTQLGSRYSVSFGSVQSGANSLEERFTSIRWEERRQRVAPREYRILFEGKVTLQRSSDSLQENQVIRYRGQTSWHKKFPTQQGNGMTTVKILEVAGTELTRDATGHWQTIFGSELLRQLRLPAQAEGIPELQDRTSAHPTS